MTRNQDLLQSNPPAGLNNILCNATEHATVHHYSQITANSQAKHDALHCYRACHFSFLGRSGHSNINAQVEKRLAVLRIIIVGDQLLHSSSVQAQITMCFV